MRWSKETWDDALYEAEIRALMHTTKRSDYIAITRLLNVLSKLLGIKRTVGAWEKWETSAIANVKMDKK